MAEIEEFAFYQENWDGYGAAPFRTGTLANAIMFDTALSAAGYSVIATPMSNGTVMLEWDAGDGRQFTLEIGSTKISGLIDRSEIAGASRR